MGNQLNHNNKQITMERLNEVIAKLQRAESSLSNAQTDINNAMSANGDAQKLHKQITKIVEETHQSLGQKVVAGVLTKIPKKVSNDWVMEEPLTPTSPVMTAA